MPSDFDSVQALLQTALVENLIKLHLSKTSECLEKPVGLEYRYSNTLDTLCKHNAGSTDNLCSSPSWSLSNHFSTEKMSSKLRKNPWRTERSVSMVDNQVGGLCTNNSSKISAGTARSAPPATSTRYKTELCRTFEERGTCRYGEKCQFAHGQEELRGLSRHPKYKTELCRTYHTVGYCPYGTRCHFIHNAEEQQLVHLLTVKQQRQDRPQLRQSVSFGGFPSKSGFQNFQETFNFRASSSGSTPASPGCPDLPFPVLTGPPGFRNGKLVKPASFFGMKSGFEHNVSCCCPVVAKRPAQLYIAAPVPDSSALTRTFSDESLSDKDSCYCSSPCDSEDMFENTSKRLPIFSMLSISDLRKGV
ncbi:mRNA decay activator protein ZFP36L1-like [Protopterus annectens]|uniref:mRNA decay activator protein ZFP36L1-like n=1 Tax=Protopterus annectens TaxID=7888 RepID=UPI001CF9A688|nr:mRNA decay activator protein ZFP36L1-like [Protopterus annectens]